MNSPVVQPPTAPPRPLRLVGLFGDSRVANGINVNSSGTVKNCRGIGYWIEYFSLGAIRVPASLTIGYSGATSTTLLANLPAAISVVKAAGGVAIILLGCSTNDRTATSPTISYATTAANYAAMQALVLSAGLACIWIAELPRGDTIFTGSALTGQALTDQLAAEAWPQSQIALSGINVARPFRTISDLSSKANADAAYAILGYLFDGLHPAPLGAYNISSKAWDVISGLVRPTSYLPQSNADVWSAGTPNGAINSNPLVVGTGGNASTNVTGPVATNYTARCLPGTGGTVSAVSSLVTGADGIRWDQFVFSGTSGSTFDYFNFFEDVTIGSQGTSIGQLLWEIAAWQVDAGQTGLAGVSVGLSDTNGVFFTQSGTRASGTDAYPNVALDGIGIADPFAIQTGTTGVRVGVQVVFQTSAAVSATVRVGQIAARAA